MNHARPRNYAKCNIKQISKEKKTKNKEDRTARKKIQKGLQIKSLEENSPRKFNTFKPPSSSDFQNAAGNAGQLQFFGASAPLAEATAFADWLAPLRRCDWVVYAKRPFAGPAAVLAYLSRYTHRVAISNRRLIAFDERSVTFRWKDYRAQGSTRYKTMTLSADEFMRRFLLHVLPSGFHRIRHYGLIANTGRRENLVRARQLLGVERLDVNASLPQADASASLVQPTFVCPCCGAAMTVIQIFVRGQPIRAPPQPQQALT